MLKNPCKATKFYYDSHDKHPPESPLDKGGLRGVCILQERLAGLAGGLCGVAGRPFSAHLPSVSNTIFAMFKVNISS